MKHFFPIAAACVLLSWTNTSSAQSTCNNQDFEDSTFTNWGAATGLNNNGILQPITWTPGVVSNGNNAACSDPAARHTIITVNGLDPTVTDPLTSVADTQMTLLAPNGGVASVRLGNMNVNYEAEKLVLPYTVTSSNTFFQFQYASVMQDPGHQWHEQPFFMVNVYDQTMTAVPSLCDTIWAGDTSVPYLVSGNDPYLLYRRWTPLSIDMSAFVGTTMTIEFVNADCVFSGHFGYTYIDVSCFGSGIPNVWPGDCDYDLQANIVDVLTLGVTYGSTGTTRVGATTTWQAEPSADWAQHVPLGANYKHSDTNGDGIVDINDTLAISLNYNQTHTFRQQNPAVDPLTAPMLYLDPVMDTVGASSVAYIDIYLANAAMPVNDLYGISFTVSYDNMLVQSGSAQTTFNGSFVGVKNSTMIAMANDNSANGENDIALCRLTHTEVNGYGYIGTLRIITAGVTSLSTLQLEITNVKAINGQMVNIPIASMGAPIVIDPAAGITDPVAPNHIGLYPNPANESLVITTNASETIEITNALGQIVYTTTSTGTTTTVDVREFEAGVYFVSVYSEGSKSTERLIIE